MSHIPECSGLTPVWEAAIVPARMAHFHLFWVRTLHQWDDGFVVARSARAAACFVRDENFVFDSNWATAERLTTLPDHLQSAEAALAVEPDEPRHVDWASPEVLAACGVTVVHPDSPRVFLWHETLLTEGVLEYLRHRHLVEALDAYAAVESTIPVGDDDEIAGRA